jgi:hypothetical protein
MTRIRTQSISTWLLITLLALLLSACTGEAAQEVMVNIQSPPAALPTTEIAPSPTASPSPTPSPTPEPLTLFLSGSLPPGLIVQEDLPISLLSDDPGAALWFGIEHNAPDGEVLQTSTWVYALAAPFPTLVDDAPLGDLQAYWQGNPAGALEAVPRLLIPDALVQLLSVSWGSPDPDRVQPYQEQLQVAALWETGAWAVLPFEALEPRLKVISVEGVSPLFKDFDPAGYPFAVRFQLVKNASSAVVPQYGQLLTIINAIQPTNRAPNRMTTLVMTGVTALVRGTAYRMEMHGVTYPGEMIRHWLTEADLTHLSNEVSFYEDCPFPDPSSQSLLFCSDPKYIELFEYVGADIIELTGNHNNDSLIVYGHDAVPFTLDLYEQYGMAYFGGGIDLADAKTPLLVTHNGNNLAFIGCNAFGPDFAWATEERGGSAPCEDYRWMADEISRLRSEGYLPIATFQYYEDYYNFAATHHIRDFGLMAEAGAVIVNGSQAHRPKAMTFAHDAFIDYGLGNFFFDQKWVIDMYDNVIVQTSWEIIQRHTFYDGRHLSTELLTALLEDYAQPRPMTPAERELFLTELFEASGWISR